MEEMPKTYDTAAVEQRMLDKWLEGDYYRRSAGVGDCTVTIPPPNVTGKLHMGHAMDDTIQDTFVRFNRMRGRSTRWILGTDHAGIATQTKVDKKLAAEGISRREIGRDKFIDACWDWTNEYGGFIVEQVKRMGCSVDFSDPHFTMDDDYAKGVRKVFCDWYHDDLIYRGKRIVNWCPHCTTAIADDEAEYKEEDGHLWHLRYPLVEPIDGQDYIVVATTRPETMLGDSAVAVNPSDERYQHLVGRKVLLPIVNRQIPIVADSYVDMEFGTGVVKITPAHDPNDFEVGKRHNLEQINILNDDATINENGGKFEGMDRYEARKAIVKELDDMGLLVRIEDYSHNVGTHDRCGTTIEPMIKKQWFVKMDELIKPAVKAVQEKEIRLIPERMEKTYFNWTDNIKDWCISRQLWWGHRIPAYYCDSCGETVVARTEPTVCPKCGGTHFTQDPDTLDTWFSSALWPFSTLGWPEKTKELEYFYPTDVLVTGYDIIFFWVIRMIFSGYEQMGEKPFKTVLFHGLVRDSQGRKMSKSLGNGIDPLEIIDKYGADALRLTLITGNAPGNDMRFYMERVEANRNFANKVWNASRFILMNMEGKEVPADASAHLEPADKWILSRLNNVVKEVTDNM